MNFEFTALAIGASLFVAVLICGEIVVWNRMRASEARLKKVQEEFNALQLRKLRGLVVALNANSKAETPKIDSCDAQIEMSGAAAHVQPARVNAVSTAAETSTRMPLLELSRYSFSGRSISFPGLSIVLIIAAIAAPLAYIFLFDSSQTPPPIAGSQDVRAGVETGERLAIVSTTPPVDRQFVTPAERSQTLHPMIEPQNVPARAETGAEREVQLLSLQTTTRLESKPNASDSAAPPPSDGENTPSESGATAATAGAIPGPRPDGEAPQIHQAQAPSSLETSLATAWTKAPADAPATEPVPAPQAPLQRTDSQSIVAETEAESEVQTQPIQTAAQPDNAANEAKARITELQPVPDLEGGMGENKQADSEIKAAPDVPPTLGSQAVKLLTEQGRRLFEAGDVVAARVLFNRAANAGDAAAAIAMGTTYDPASLRNHGVLGIVGDREKARMWYDSAKRLGAPQSLRQPEFSNVQARAKDRTAKRSPRAPAASIASSSRPLPTAKP